MHNTPSPFLKAPVLSPYCMVAIDTELVISHCLTSLCGVRIDITTLSIFFRQTLVYHALTVKHICGLSLNPESYSVHSWRPMLVDVFNTNFLPTSFNNLSSLIKLFHIGLVKDVRVPVWTCNIKKILRYRWIIFCLAILARSVFTCYEQIVVNKMLL